MRSFGTAMAVVEGGGGGHCDGGGDCCCDGSYRVGIQYQVLNVRSVSVCIRRCLVSDSGEN